MLVKNLHTPMTIAFTVTDTLSLACAALPTHRTENHYAHRTIAEAFLPFLQSLKEAAVPASFAQHNALTA